MPVAPPKFGDIRTRRLFIRISEDERAQYQAAADAARKRLSTWVRETLGKASEASSDHRSRKGDKYDG